jgi:hypothetical protein
MTKSVAMTGRRAAPERSLLRVGGTAALLAAVLILAEAVFFVLNPQPGTVGDWFALFQHSPALGLLSFWGLEVLMYLGFSMVFLALFVELGRADYGRALSAAVLAFVGIGVFLATNNPFTMLSLSGQYAAATTEAQRAALLAAGQAVLANTGQRAVGGFNMGLMLVSVAGLLFSYIMLRVKSFGRSIGLVGLVAHGLSLLDYLRQAITASPVATLLVVVPNAILLVVWYLLAGRRLRLIAGHEALATTRGPEVAHQGF